MRRNEKKEADVTIHGIQFITYIQMLSADKVSCVLRLRSGTHRGILCMEDGEVFDAKTQRNEADKALLEILSWQDPEIKFVSSDKQYGRKIHRSLEFFLLENAKHEDEMQEKKETSASPLRQSRQEKKSSSSKNKSLWHEITSTIKAIDNVDSFMIIDNKGSVLYQGEEDTPLSPDFLNHVHRSVTSSVESVSTAVQQHSFLFELNTDESFFVFCHENSTIGLVASVKSEMKTLSSHVMPLFPMLTKASSMNGYNA